MKNDFPFDVVGNVLGLLGFVRRRRKQPNYLRAARRTPDAPARFVSTRRRV